MSKPSHGPAIPVWDAACWAAVGRHGLDAFRRAEPRPNGSLHKLKAVALLAVGVPVAAMIWPISLGGSSSWTMVMGQSMEPTLDPGDLVVTRARSDYEIGDVVVYRIPDGDPGDGIMVIHRIVDGSNEEGFITLGDNRDHFDPWRPTADDIVGKHWRTVPAGGSAVAWLRSPLAMALAASGMAFVITLELLATLDQRAPRHALSGDKSMLLATPAPTQT